MGDKLLGGWVQSVHNPFAGQLGVVVVMTCEIGFLTPPIGVNLFVAARISKISIEDISVGVLPLLIPYMLMILILVFFSDWVTWLPDLVYGPQLR